MNDGTPLFLTPCSNKIPLLKYRRTILMHYLCKKTCICLKAFVITSISRYLAVDPLLLIFVNLDCKKTHKSLPHPSKKIININIF